MSIDFVNYGKALKEIRINRNLTQVEVRKKIGLSIETQRLIENGYNEPRLSTLESLSTLYKVDLIYLLHQYREDTDFFSESFISETNQLLNDENLQGFKQKIIELVDNIKSTYSDNKLNGNTIAFLSYLESFKDWKIFDIKNKEKHIIALENILALLSTSKSEYLSGVTFYYIEIQIAIFLSNAYRRNNDFDKAFYYLDKIKTSLELKEFKSLREMDFYITSIINIIRIYLRLDRFDEIVQLVDSTMNQNGVHFKKEHFSELMISKGIAYYFMKNRSYSSLFETVLLYENSNRIEKYIKGLTGLGIELEEIMKKKDEALL